MNFWHNFTNCPGVQTTTATLASSRATLSVPKYNSEVFLLYLSIYIFWHFIVLLHNIVKAIITIILLNLLDNLIGIVASYFLKSE